MVHACSKLTMRVVFVSWLRVHIVSLSVVLGALGSLRLLSITITIYSVTIHYNSFCFLSAPLSIVMAHDANCL
jgi:hypothetical protein